MSHPPQNPSKASLSPVRSVALGAAFTLAFAACAPAPADSLERRSVDSADEISAPPSAPAAPAPIGNSHAQESTGGENGITDIPVRKEEEARSGTPAEVAKMHGAQKVTYRALGVFLRDVGVDLTASAAAAGAASAAALYVDGKSALGAPIYASRTPEMIVPSTSSLAKEFDIFVAAAPAIIANIGKSKRCPGVVLVDVGGQITADGLSCLMGKPATKQHVALANKLVTDIADPVKGPPIAVATILAAAHISE